MLEAFPIVVDFNGSPKKFPDTASREQVIAELTQAIRECAAKHGVGVIGPIKDPFDSVPATNNLLSDDEPPWPEGLPHPDL